jgi:hypothetical protein
MRVFIKSPPTEPEVYNQTFQFEYVSQAFIQNSAESYLSKIGEIFLRHGLQNQFGLGLCYIHFDLMPDEVLVESMCSNQQLFLSIPWIVDKSKEQR